MTRTNEGMTSANLTWLQVLHFRFESAKINWPEMLMDRTLDAPKSFGYKLGTKWGRFGNK